MPDLPDFPLSRNQQAMLDLALACDLKTSDLSQHPRILECHRAIKSHEEAARYIQDVETRIHSRRTVRHLFRHPSL